MRNISKTGGTKRGDGHCRNLAPQWNKAAPARGVAEAERKTQTSPFPSLAPFPAEPGWSQYHGNLQASGVARPERWAG